MDDWAAHNLLRISEASEFSVPRCCMLQPRLSRPGQTAVLSSVVAQGLEDVPFGRPNSRSGRKGGVVMVISMCLRGLTPSYCKPGQWKGHWVHREVVPCGMPEALTAKSVRTGGRQVGEGGSWEGTSREKVLVEQRFHYQLEVTRHRRGETAACLCGTVSFQRRRLNATHDDACARLV